MATNNLKFFHVAGLPSTGAVTGGIYFDKTAGELAVWNGTAWERYSGNVKDVKWSGTPANDSGKLVITDFAGNKTEINFSDVASKTQVATDIADAKAAAIKDAKDYVNARKVNGKTLNADIVLDGRDIKLDGYSKPASTSDIEATDTINQALGKLEAAIEDTGGNALTHVTAGAGIDVTNKVNHDQTISVKLDPATENFLSVGGAGLKLSGVQTAITTAIENLDVPDAAVDNQYVSSVSETDGKIKVTRADLPVIGVADNDKILSLSGAKIGAGLNFEYSTTDKKIYLYGSAKDDAHKIGEVDCTAFIKDGMLDSATYNDKTHILTLTFNTESGENGVAKTPIEVDLSTLVDTYDAGDGLTLDKTGAHPTFKISLTEGGNYLGIVDGKLRLDETTLHSKISGDIETEIGKLNATKFNDGATGAGADASTQIKVQVNQAKGVLTGVTVNAPIFALPADIATAKNELVGSNTTDTKDSNTIWGAKKYADDIVAAAKTAVNTSTDNKIKDLNATVDQNKDATGTFSTTGIKAQVVETAGKLTGVTVSIADGTYAKPADITTEIGKLNATKSNTEATITDVSSQIKVTVSEEKGVLKGVTVNAPAFDLSGAAAGALGDAKTYTDEKIQGLDSTVSQAASETEGLALQVVETDGKLTSVSGSMNWCQW